MVFTYDDYLPSYEELTVPEITMTSAPLKAGAIYFGKYCDDYCKVGLTQTKIWNLALDLPEDQDLP